MPLSKSQEKKAIKTLHLVGIINLFILPLELVDSRLCLIASLAINARFIYELHDLGKRRRPGSNIINKAAAFFSTPLEADVLRLDNCLRNIINGGAALHDHISVESLKHRP